MGSLRHRTARPLRFALAALAAILYGSLALAAPVLAIDGAEFATSATQIEQPPAQGGELPESVAETLATDATSTSDPEPLIEAIRVQVDNVGVGWRAPVADGGSSGGAGIGQPLRAVRLWVEGSVAGSIEYRVRQGAWSEWVRDGETAGDGRSAITAIEARLADEVAGTHDLHYRADSLVAGWLGWAGAGETAGSREGVPVAIEAIQVVLVPKGGTAPASDGASSSTFASPTLAFTATGDRRGEYAPATSGNGVGMAGVPLMDVRAWLVGDHGADAIQYRVRIGGSWTPWAAEGASASQWSLEPITRVEFRLTGHLADYYDLWYRTHVSGVGWMGYAKGPYSAGVGVDRLGIEAIQLHLVPKGQTAPGPTAEPCLMDVGRYDCGPTTPEGAAIVRACFQVPSPGGGLCAMWVSQVSDRATGVYHWLDADGMYYRLHETDSSKLMPGMAVAVSTHGHTYLGGLYGHVGYYIGNGLVMENVSYIRTSAYGAWDAYYSDRVPVRLGWL